MTLEELREKAIALNKEQQYTQVADLLPDSILTQYNDAALYNESADAWSGRGEGEMAIRDYTRAITLEPDNYMHYAGRGTSFMFLNEYQKAIKDFTKEIELKPDNEIAYFNRGEAWKAVGDLPKALADYNWGIRIKPDFDMLYVGRGHSYYLSQLYDEALIDQNKVIKLNPDNVFGWSNRGKTRLKKKQFDKAVEDFTKAIALSPENADAYQDRAQAWFEMKQYDKALEDHNIAIKLNPYDKMGFVARADTWYEMKEFEKAIEDYTSLIDLDPYDKYGYHSRAFCWRELKQYDKAIEDFDVAIGLAPDDVYQLFGRASAKHDKLEDEGGTKEAYEDAIRDYGEAIKMKPDDSIAYTNRGVLWCAIEEYNKAIQDLEKALQLNPEDHVARRWILVTRARQQRSPMMQNENDKQAIRERAAFFVEQIRGYLNVKCRQSKNAFLFGWFVEVWETETNRPVTTGIRGWLPEIMPDIAKWKLVTDEEGDEELEVYTRNNEEFWPSLAGIPIKKNLWVAMVSEGKQYLIGEKPMRAVKNFEPVNLLLERITARIRSGKLDNELVFGEYTVPTQMEDFTAMLDKILTTPKKKK